MKSFRGALRKTPIAKDRGLNVGVVTNEVEIKEISQGYRKIVPFGLDNMYPNSIFNIASNSPTAKGCVNRLFEFIFGLGVEGGDFIVNRKNETLNDVLNKCAFDMALYRGFVLHFDFNALGQITGIQNADIRYTRKSKTLMTAYYGQVISFSNYNKNVVEFPLYSETKFKEHVKEAGGFKKFKGSLYYYMDNGTIYPQSSINASSTSATFEDEVQTYNVASIHNGFSASGVLKTPFQDKRDGEEIDPNSIEGQLHKMKGADNAGSMVVVEMPRKLDGGLQELKLFEPFTIPNIDNMFVNQSKSAKDSIMTEFNMPMILLGQSDSGMFNQASFNDAFNYYNDETKSERIKLERSFNNFWNNTVFTNQLSEIEITPLESKGDENGSATNND